MRLKTLILAGLFFTHTPPLAQAGDEVASLSCRQDTVDADGNIVRNEVVADMSLPFYDEKYGSWKFGYDFHLDNVYPAFKVRIGAVYSSMTMLELTDKKTKEKFTLESTFQGNDQVLVLRAGKTRVTLPAEPLPAALTLKYNGRTLRARVKKEPNGQSIFSLSVGQKSMTCWYYELPSPPLDVVPVVPDSTTQTPSSYISDSTTKTPSTDLTLGESPITQTSSNEVK
jgi:hypothetical protein